MQVQLAEVGVAIRVGFGTLRAGGIACRHRPFGLRVHLLTRDERGEGYDGESGTNESIHLPLLSQGFTASHPKNSPPSRVQSHSCPDLTPSHPLFQIDDNFTEDRRLTATGSAVKRFQTRR